MKLQKIKCSKFYNCLFVLILLFSIQSTFARKSDKVLIFSKIAGFRHLSIPAGIKAIIKLGEENGFSVDPTKFADRATEIVKEEYQNRTFLEKIGNNLNKVVLERFSIENVIEQYNPFNTQSK